MADEPTLTTCAVAYFDLLAYGALLQAASAQLSHPAARHAVDRVNRFHNLARLANGPPGVRVRRLNDAVVATKDLDSTTGELWRFTDRSLNPFVVNETGAQQFCDFLTWVKEVHDDVRHDQRDHGDPGARTVVVVEARLAGQDELHLNIAFALAYLSEQRGSSAGLVGDFLYVHWLPYAQMAVLADRKVVLGTYVTLPGVLGREMRFAQFMPQLPGGQLVDVVQPGAQPTRDITTIWA